MINATKLVILEAIMIDHRYSDLKDLIGCDELRSQIVNGIVRRVLRDSKHECEFLKNVDIHLGVALELADK